MSTGWYTHTVGLSGYEDILPIASGGMGRVDLAVRTEGSFQRLYAVKRLHPSLDDPEFREMFLDEGRLAGLIRHANVVSVLDVGADDSGPYLVMEYVDGVPLSRLLKDTHVRGTKLPLQIACRLLIDVAHGLHAAHELTTLEGDSLRLVHRDVSPQNILIGFDGVARVTDFGVAKPLGLATRNKTATGMLKGKLGYMSPEQLQFLDIDQRSDLFSLGVLLYETVAGSRLYNGETGPRRILHDPIPDLGDARAGLPPALVELCFRLLAKSPEQRPATALDVAEALEDILANLVNDEGPITIASHLDGQYSDTRVARAEEVKTAIALRSELSRTQAQQPQTGWLIPLLVVVVLIAGIAAWRVTQQDHREETHAPTVETSPAQEPDPVRESLPTGLNAPEEPPARVEPARARMSRMQRVRPTMRQESMTMESTESMSVNELEIWTMFE